MTKQSFNAHTRTMKLMERGDIVVARVSQDLGQVDCLPMLVVDVFPEGLWDDTPTICGLWLGKLDLMKVTDTDEPKLLLSVYGPHPSRLCYRGTHGDDELTRWDLVHVHTHTYLPVTESALENIEIVGQANEAIFPLIEEKSLRWLGLLPLDAPVEEYEQYAEKLAVLDGYYAEAVRIFWERYGSNQGLVENVVG